MVLRPGAAEVTAAPVVSMTDRMPSAPAHRQVSVSVPVRRALSRVAQ
jgi:hypothetical protein